MKDNEIKKLGLQVVKNIEDLLSEVNDIYDFLEGVQEFIMDLTDDELLQTDDSNPDRRENGERKEEI